MDDPTFTITKTTAKASSLYLSYKSQYDPSAEGIPREWIVNFQTLPVRDVILTGDEPTRDELVHVLMSTMMPVIFLPIIESVIAMILRSRVGADSNQQ